MLRSKHALGPALLVACSLAPGAPLAAGDDTDPPREALRAELPFLNGEGSNRVVVDLAPENHSKRLRVWLDTGAGHSTFSPGAAREAGVSVRRVKRRPYRRSTLLDRDLEFYVDTRSSDQGARMGWEYGLLGGNFLQHYVVEIDFPGRTVRFYDPDRFEVPESSSVPGEAIVPVEIVARRPMLELTLNGQTLPVLIDTGSAFGLVLAGEVAQRADVRIDRNAKLRAQMILGPVRTLLGSVDRLEIGPFALQDVPAAVAPEGLYNWAGRTNSVVGYDVLAEFVVRLDYRRGRMWLRRAPDARRTFLGNDWALYRRHGVLLAPVANQPDAFQVTSVSPESPAAGRGLAVGDVLRDAASLERAIETLATEPVVRVLRRMEDDAWREHELGPPADIARDAASAP